MVNQRISIKDVQISLNGNTLGGSESATITIARDNEEAYEGGSYTPVEIVGGKFHITGSLTRAFIDTDTLNEIMPNLAIPSNFTIHGEITSGKTPQRSITIFGAVFDSIEISDLGLDGYAKNTLPFKATSWRFD